MDIESDTPLLAFQKKTLEELDWIDLHHPEYEHSTQSTSTRTQQESIFTKLAAQAEMILKMRRMKRDLHKPVI
jgi:hypothetical protein